MEIAAFINIFQGDIMAGSNLIAVICMIIHSEGATIIKQRVAHEK